MKYVAKFDFKFSPNGYDIESYVAGQDFPYTGDLLENAKRDGLVELEKQNPTSPQKKTSIKSKAKEIIQSISNKIK